MRERVSCVDVLRMTQEEREADALETANEFDKIMEKCNVMMSTKRYIRPPARTVTV